jgi:non-heme chloroperoxidase
MTKEIKTVRLPNNVTLLYVEHGNGTGLPMLLLHGFAGSWRSFQELLPLLPETIHAFAPTQRGHGEASHPDTGYAPQDFASDMQAFLDALDLRAAVIVGHSMGASIALRFAADYPAQTLGLVSISARARMKDRPGLKELWETKISKLEDPADRNFIRSFVESTFDSSIRDDTRDALFQDSLKVPAKVWRQAFRTALQADLLRGIDNISVPTLLIWGAKDKSISRADQDAIAGRIAGSQRIVYPGIGHSPHIEAPNRLAGDLIDFIESNIH